MSPALEGLPGEEDGSFIFGACGMRKPSSYSYRLQQLPTITSNHHFQPSFLPAFPNRFPLISYGSPRSQEGFDPMGFSLAIDIRWLREAELKHGRVAMLATVGWITTVPRLQGIQGICV